MRASRHVAGTTEFLVTVAGVTDTERLAAELGVTDVLGQYNVMLVQTAEGPAIKLTPVSYQVVGRGPSEPAIHVLRVAVTVLAKVSVAN